MLRRFLKLRELDDYTRLYHYTRGASAQEILKKQIFFATNTQFLNDVNEMQYILGVLDEVIGEIDRPMRRGTLQHLILEDLAEFHKYEYYLISFSTKPDSLTLWAEFGDRTGYNLEFNGTDMRDRIRANLGIFCHGYVVYDRAFQKKCLRDLILEEIPRELGCSFGNIMDSLEQGKNPVFEEYKLTLQKTLSVYALFFKQPEFASEQEYRFIFRDPDTAVFFREQNGFLLPYIQVNCAADGWLPVHSVTVAPKNHIDLARRGMEYYLKSLGYDVPVKLSRLKLRY